MKVYIYVDESIFCGNHGIYDVCVVEVNDFKEAREISMEMGDELYYTYEHVFSNSDYDEEDWYVNANIWKIKDEYQTTSVKELDSICAESDYKDFIKTYCGECLYENL